MSYNFSYFFDTLARDRALAHEHFRFLSPSGGRSSSILLACTLNLTSKNLDRNVVCGKKSDQCGNSQFMTKAITRFGSVKGSDFLGHH